MAVVDGRASLLEECRLSPLELRNDLAAQFLELLKTSAFLEALPAFLSVAGSSQPAATTGFAGDPAGDHRSG
jgi:hypothetical protein